MKDAFKPVRGIFIIFLGVAVVMMISTLLRPGDIIPWRADLATAQAEARETDRPVFAYFTADWCGPCRQMSRTTWADSDVETALQDYVPVKIDIDEHQDLAMQYGIRSIPAFLVFDEQGMVVNGGGGALPPADFIDWLRR